VTDENGSPPGEGQLPGRHVTVNQVVAWNLAWYRHEAGLTQAEMGAAMGWSKSAVSDAERSVSGKWTREFDAHTLTLIAGALGIPVLALFLPPSDDGVEVRYVFDGWDDGAPQRLDMTDLMTLVLPDSGSDSPAMKAYRDRLREEMGSRFGEHAKAEADRWMEDAGGAELRADMVARHRSRRDRFLAMAAEEDDMADFFEGSTP
jgi:transcriptional regulator with XRE-family HTH domain